VFVTATALSSEELAFFSGFVAGDGSFSIQPNNGGATWRCCLQVKLRADNTPLLATFREWTGAGELFHAPARAGSRPQTAWIVARQADCLRVVHLLDARPPLGKAAYAFRLWKRAALLWTAEGGCSPALAELAAELASRHRTARPAPCEVDITERDLAAFLAGFASAEAHFGATDAGSPSFTINLRADDAPLLRLFQSVFELGYLREVKAAGRSQAALSWRVGRLDDLRRLVSLFDEHPPRGRAADVYAAWRELILLKPRPAGARRALAREVRRQRQFVPGLDDIEPTSSGQRSQERCVAALRRWADSAHYPGSAVDYERWRQTDRSAPTRNTVAAAWGSWSSALAAAGISDPRSHEAAHVAAIRAGHESRGEAQRARTRAAIVDVVRRCIAELGREPGATEFLAWRREHAPASPSQMTIYRHFPDGFDEVVAVAQGRLGTPMAR
jgi:LAGLIDADG DNA endonuclease family protein